VLDKIFDQMETAINFAFTGISQKWLSQLYRGNIFISDECVVI